MHAQVGRKRSMLRFCSRRTFPILLGFLTLLLVIATAARHSWGQQSGKGDGSASSDELGREFDQEIERALDLKNRALADLEKDLQRAKDRINNAKFKDLDSALVEAQKMRDEAVARFDASLAEAARIKREATASLEADFQAAKQAAERKFPTATQDLRKDTGEVLSLAEGGKKSAAQTPPVTRTARDTKKRAPSGPTISLEESGTPTGVALEDTTNLAKRSKASSLPNQAIPLQELPARPPTLFHLGDSFFGSGPIEEGFEIPTGAVWQPQFFPFGTYSMAVQTFDDANQQVNEWVTTFDVYGNLNLTPTERFLIGFNFLDKDGRFTGYEFYPEKRSLNAANGNVATLFFEGRVGSLFPGLKSKLGEWASLDFAVGRQELSYQSGILINDIIDSVGFTRTSTYLLGSNSATITGVYGWNFINRGDNKLDKNAMLFGLFSTFNYPERQIAADMVVVFDTGSNPRNGLNLAISSFQTLWERVNLTLRINQSIALNGSSEGSGTGTLFFAQLNMQTPYSLNNLYLNLFGGINRFTSAARDPNAGGPLGQTGILFAATGLGTFGPALPDDGQDVFGTSLGYQMFLGSIRRQLILELGGTTKDSAFAFGGQFEQAFGRHFVWTLNSFVGYYGANRLRRIGYGARSVWTVDF